MKKAVYYISYSGAFLTMRDIESAFTVMTGKRRERNEGKYIKFLNMLFKKNKIIKYVTPTVEDLVKMGRTYNAIMQYRREHDKCTVREAYEFVHAIAEKLKGNDNGGVPVKSASMLAEIPKNENVDIKDDSTSEEKENKE